VAPDPLDRSESDIGSAGQAGAERGPTHRVVFTPSGLSGEVEQGTTALAAARALGVDLDSVCGGRGVCGRCQVEPALGRFDKWAVTVEAANFGVTGASEATYRLRRQLTEGRRLGCDVRILGDVVFDVPPESQIHRQVVRKSVVVDGLVVDPMVTLHYVELDADDPGDGTSVTARIQAQLAADHSVERARFAPAHLPGLHRAAAEDALTVALGPADGEGERSVLGLWPGYVERVFGVAVDVGSTTIAGHLCDLASGEVVASGGRMNPQIRFGEDLMSRVSYVMMNAGGRDQLTGSVRRALDELVGELIEQATGSLVDGVDRGRILDVVLVGNPVMHHLFLGIDPCPLGQAPFTLATDGPVRGRAADVGIDAPSAGLYVAPCIAGHVGADTAAAILAEAPHRSEAVQLLVDVGTNAEIVLGNRDRLFAASSPTGPAFEGAQISAGQRATAGAIERVRIDRVTLEPRFRVIGCDLWSNEDGFEAGTASTGVTGICGSGIIEVMAELFLAGVIDAQGVIGGSAHHEADAGPEGDASPEGDAGPEGRSDRIEADGRTFAYRLTDRILITQADVRAIQLAKAALRAGIDLLLEHAGLDAVDEIRLAGAFGAHIDPVHAMVLGLVPDCPIDRVRSVGNAAGSGAVRALLSAGQRREMERAVAGVTKIETATEPRFQELFVAALAFPHLDAPTTHLATVVDLPPRPEGHGGDGIGRRRRRVRSRSGS
jgi:uncharacterized 2Fe-2S/4Fe-4S cluster protein (DUF4445 family)